MTSTAPSGLARRQPGAVRMRRRCSGPQATTATVDDSLAARPDQARSARRCRKASPRPAVSRAILHTCGRQ